MKDQFQLEAPLGQPYWWREAVWGDYDQPPPANIDVLIIGAGFTGLSAAIAAHDTGGKVAVIDAGQPGKGASTRNGGMTGAHPRLTWQELCQKFGRSTADKIFAEAPIALQFVRDLIESEAFECDLQQTGRIQLAWSASHFETQKGIAKSVVEKSKVQVDVVPKHDLGQHIATPTYYGGIYFPDHCGLDPYKYHRGLLQAVLKRGISVCGHLPAQDIQQTGAQFRVKTPKGEISAGKVILATNGYTSSNFRWHSARVFPLPSYLIATEEMDPNRINDIAPGGRMMVETRARHSYFRPSPDGKRILFGGRASMANLDVGQAAKRLHATMTEIWPDLQATKIAYAWTGNTGYTFSHMPKVGEHQGVHYAMGFSGSGTVMAPYLGMKAAYQALGDARGETGYSHVSLGRSWLHPFHKPYFLKAADGWYRQWVDRWESRVRFR